ncbi:MAG: YidC/Oxa1 family insertase periplasmic-domain containing protein [Planctomycetota bacterium]|nr:YidC/Oxa1 family insertase periplasmic-domain containing protein [Planctomycetota bacterium]
MDNKRFFAYLLLGLSIFLLFNSMQRQQLDAKRRTDEQAEVARKAKEKREEELRDVRAKAEQAAEFVPRVEPARSFHFLGSMNPEDGYSLLVCLDNRGAGINRIEIVERDNSGKLKYRWLQEKERRGYAGYLALDTEQDAFTIRSVPVGSPAASAKCSQDKTLVGLQPGDRIVGWDDLEGEPSKYRWEQWVDSWRVGKSVQLTVERNGQKLAFDIVLGEKPLDVVRAEDDFRFEQVQGNDPVASCLTTIASINGKEIDDGEAAILGLESTLTGNWDVKTIDVDNGMGIEFTMPIQSNLKLIGVDADIEMVKQYRLHRVNAEAKPESKDRWQYHIDLTTTIRNKDIRDHKIAVRQEGLNGISLEGWWYPTKISPYFFSAAGARDIIVGDGADSHTLTTTRSVVSHGITETANPELELFGPANTDAKRTLNYIGIDTQAFTAALLPSVDEPDSLKLLHRGKARLLNSVYRDAIKLPSYKQQAANVGYWIETEEATFIANSEKTFGYTVFAGPKDPQLLAAYKLDKAIYYGWGIFDFFARQLRFILHGFHYIVGNFGIAIMMLTVLVRSCMFPVSRKMALNAQKMQSVQPHTAKLREAFKEDPRKMMAAQQLLMKKAGVNQFAGCLPALIQLPIVIGLYRCVSVDVGLRQQSLIPGWDWCSNLAGPDMLVEWHSWMPDFIAGRGTGYFGPYFNILPIITITLFIIQQKVLMPKATDEQTAIAQKMMMFMTVAMGVLFFRVPAGLCIYFITSSTWSLVERFLIKRYTPKGTSIDLPENTAHEIIQTVNKLGTGAVAQQRSATTNSDKPKEKMTKPPETLAELFPGWFGKKESTNGSTGSSQSKPKGSSSQKPPERKGKRPKPK